MDCHEIESTELAEKYLLGQLGADEQQSYEEHYFQCAKCFEDLQLRQTIQSELGKMRPGGPVVKAGRGRINWLAWGAVAAAVLVAAGLEWWRFHSTPAAVTQVAPHVAKSVDNAPALELLARADPPAYTASTLRGGSPGSGARFREGMAQYRVGNYEAAIVALTSAAGADPKSADAQFFLGICYLLTGHSDGQPFSNLDRRPVVAETVGQFQAECFTIEPDCIVHVRDVEGNVAAGKHSSPIIG